MAKKNIFGNSDEQIKNINQELTYVLDAVTSIGDKLVSSFKEAVDEAVELGDVTETMGNTLKKGYSRDLRDISKITEDLIKANARQTKGLLKQSEIAKLQNRLAEAQALKKARIEIAERNGVALSKEQTAELEKQVQLAQEALDEIEKYNNRLGVGGTLMQSLKDKIKGINRLDVAKAAFLYLAKQIKAVDEEVTNLQRNFALTKGEAIALNETLAKSALNARTLGVNLDTVTKATNDLNDYLGGTALLFNEDIRNGIAYAEERLGLSAEAATLLATQATRSGKAYMQVLGESEAIYKSVKATTGVTLNYNRLLEESARVSGATRLNLEAFPGGIIEAVAQTKALGMEMNQVRSIASGLLDFESSIAAELHAEAITGRQINLEKARLLALNKDDAGLAKEIASQFGSIAEFQQMNALGQEAFANALNLSSDELADILNKEATIQEMIETGVETQGESLTKNSAALSVQKQLVESMNMLNTTLKTSLSLLFGLAAAAAVLAAPFTAGMSLGALAGITALAGGAGFALGEGVQAVADGAAPSSRGPFTITDSYGATAVTTQGDNVVVSPNVSQGGGGITASQANEMIALLRRVADKEFSVSMDSRKLSETIQTSGVSYDI